MSVKLLLYCTKAKQKIRVTEHLYMYEDDLYKLPNGKIKFGNSFELSLYDGQYSKDNFLNGKIVAECECQKVEEIFATKWSVGYCCNYYQFKTKDLLIKSRLNWIDLTDYLQDKNGYGLHLSNVKVFNEPKELGKREYVHYDRIHLEEPRIKFSVLKPLTNMMYVYDNQGTEYILIPVQSEHLCKILNGEKTIEVRKKVLNSLKEMLEDE